MGYRKINMETLSKNSEDITVLKKVSEGNYELNYGTIIKGKEVKIELEFSPGVGIKKFFAKPSCGGCTKVKVLYAKEEKAGVFIEYDTELLGRINKVVYFYYEDVNKKEYKTEIKLTGKIEE
jgi:hypothetical protein